jgi:hypothetical protein
MAEPNINYVTKREFRVVSLILVPVLVALLSLLLPCVRSFLAPKGATKSKSTPIVVRGGSMTAFTNTGNGWVEQSGAATTYCFQVDTSSIELDDNEDDSILFSQSSLQPSWTIKVWGHDPDHTSSKPSKNGLLFTALKQKTDCKGNPAPENTYVVVSTLGSGSFYPTRQQLPNSPSRTGNIRFLDSASVGCKCVDNDNDQDFCERMAQVDIQLDSTSKPLTRTCADGDCTLHIGPPPS